MRRFALLGLFCGASLAAQTVWNVPSGASLAPYVAQAAPGDVLVLGATHPPFTLQRGLVLMAGFGTCAIVDPAVTSITTTIQIPAGQHASIIGLSFQRAGWFLVGQQVDVTGEVRFEDCSFEAGQGTSAALAVHGGNVVLQRCFVRSTPAIQPSNPQAMVLHAGLCSVADTTFVGANGALGLTTWSSVGPTPGLLQLGGVLVGSRITAAGGRGIYNSPATSWLPPEPGFFSAGGVSYLTDSTLQGGDGLAFIANSGAVAIDAVGSVAVARCQLLVGLGASGPTTGGSVRTVPQLVGLVGGGAVVRGQSFVATAVAGSSQPLFVAMSLPAGGRPVLPVVEPVWLAPGAVVLTMVLPSVGDSVPVTFPLPNAAYLFGHGIACQAFQLDGLAVRASAVVGGVIR